MSFFKKLADEFKELKANFEDKPQEERKKKDEAQGERKTDEGKPEQPLESSHTDVRGYDDQSYGQPLHGAQQAPYGQQPQYGQSQQHYGAPPTAHVGPPGQPPLTPGWITRFDQGSQRWYFVEQATGRTQWEPPVAPQAGFAPPPNGSGDAYAGDRAHSAAPGAAAGGYYSHDSGAPPTGSHGALGHEQNAQQYYGDIKKTEVKSEEKAKDKKKDNGSRNMLLAGASGLAVGGIAGAMVAHDSDSDDGHNSHATAAAAPAGHCATAAYGGSDGYGAAPGYGQGQGYVTDPSYGSGSGYNAPPPGPPAHDSDAESLREAQKDYNEAVDAAADSDASSSELEDLQEAHEELEEEREEYYED